MQTECSKNTGPTCDDGETCEPSRQKATGKSMSSVEDSPVRIFPTPDEGQELRANDQDCFSRPFAWFDCSDPDTCCWKTWQRSLLEDWIEYTGSWHRSVIVRNRIAYRLPALVPRISGTGCSSSEQPEMWATPTAHDADNGPRSEASQKRRGSRCLQREVKLWPTPTGRDHKGCGKNGRVRDGKIQTDTLDRAVWARSPEANGGQLNPTWVEWLMGFPSGWTDLEDSETQ